MVRGKEGREGGREWTYTQNGPVAREEGGREGGREGGNEPPHTHAPVASDVVVLPTRPGRRAFVIAVPVWLGWCMHGCNG